jgi:hypothetical protein
MSSIGPLNSELIDRLTGHFATRNEFYGNGARLNAALSQPNRFGGAFHRFSWDAQRYVLDTQGGYQALTHPNVADDDFDVFGGGAPRVDLNGSNEYLWRARGAYSDIGAQSFGIYMWGTVDSLPAAAMHAVGVWGGAGDRQFRLSWAAGPGPMRWAYSDDGTAVYGLNTSHANPAAGEVFFFGGVFIPSTVDGQRTYFGLASDPELTVDDLLGGTSQAAIWTGGTGIFGIGAQTGPSQYWDGKISVFSGRTRVPTIVAADNYMQQRFAEMRCIYQ